MHDHFEIDDDSMSRTATCHACGSRDFLIERKAALVTGPLTDKHNLARCRNCGSATSLELVPDSTEGAVAPQSPDSRERLTCERCGTPRQEWQEGGVCQNCGGIVVRPRPVRWYRSPAVRLIANFLIYGGVIVGGFVAIRWLLKTQIWAQALFLGLNAVHGLIIGLRGLIFGKFTSYSFILPIECRGWNARTNGIVCLFMAISAATIMVLLLMGRVSM